MKSPLKSRLLSLTIAGILGTSILTAETVLAENVQETLSLVPVQGVSPAEARVMSRSAVQVLREIANARSAIHRKDIKKAKINLEEAIIIIDILKSEQPTAIVSDNIFIAKQHLDYESSEEVSNDLVPIEESLTEIEDFVPVEKARVHTKAAKKYLKNKDKKGAKVELDAAAAALIYTEVDLPLASTEKNVNAALQALNNKKLKQADKLLNQAEDGVRFMSSAIEAPINQAQKNLGQASKDYAAKDYNATKADLAKAGAWVDKAASSKDKRTKKEANKLKKELTAAQKKVEKKGSNLQSTLDRLWAHSKALAEYETEKATASWDKLRGNSKAKLNLIDAKLYLSYAESAQFMKGTSSEVSSELNKSSDYLKQAGKTADKKLSKKIQALNKKLIFLKKDINDHSVKAHKHYELVKGDFRKTIHDI